MPETPPSSIQTALLLPLTPGGGQAGRPSPGRARSQRSAAAGPPGVQGRTQLTDGRVGARQPRFVPPLRRVSRASQALDKSSKPTPCRPKSRPTRDVRPRGFLSRVAARSAQAARRSSSPSTALSAPGRRVRGDARARVVGIGGVPLRASTQHKGSDRSSGVGATYEVDDAESERSRRARQARVMGGKIPGCAWLDAGCGTRSGTEGGEVAAPAPAALMAGGAGLAAARASQGGLRHLVRQLRRALQQHSFWLRTST
ncbi:hypothetical protein Purlil1_8291 [Purpureocillium lilacinum]|uniref:Uncharacterized protein n=1 Tax=Purpureocillium lilacinum TaxID=33203 RepID=A0ABR0BUT1_PURLI|nr:hypothetical protein Purlil1_8291 [Purpureocillium lilacinum]